MQVWKGGDDGGGLCRYGRKVRMEVGGRSTAAQECRHGRLCSPKYIWD